MKKAAASAAIRWIELMRPRYQSSSPVDNTHSPTGASAVEYRSNNRGDCKELRVAAQMG